MVRRVLLVISVVLMATGFAGFGKTGLVEGKEAGVQVESQRKEAALKQMMNKGGYLSSEAIPDSAALLPEPPAEGSGAMAYDEEISRKNLVLRDTPRWIQAAKDADIKFPEVFEGFACIMNIPITEEATPRLYTLLRKMTLDAGKSTRAAKAKYNRPRPFLVNNEPICTPEEQGALMNNGSYPSGHTAVGWAWALILAELSPEQAGAILQRGRAFGESRMVCNVHWQSDVTEGRFMADCTVARLHGEPLFRADLEAARAEIQAARTKGLKPTCH